MAKKQMEFWLAEFDRNVFKKNWNNSVQDPLMKAAGATRKAAIRSLRKAERAKKLSTQKKPSRPGKAPKSRAAGHPMRKIYYDNDGPFAVIVGPIGFGDKDPVPDIHEEGLAVRRLVWEETQEWVTHRMPDGRAKRMRKRRRVTRRVKYPKRPFMITAYNRIVKRYPQYFDRRRTGGLK